MAQIQKPILFHYPPSIYSHRVLWYLWLRGIEYEECIQPPYMPRPDLATIDINYRRIPVMSIGKDIYCDSRLIIQTLERQFPNSALAPVSQADAGVRKLFESWTVDGGIFSNVCKLLPYWKGLFSDSKFVEDRAKLSGGRRMTAEGMAHNRPDGLAHMRQAFEMLETTFLSDGRKWILATEGPTTADIDAVWPFEWLIVDPGMEGALDENFINEKMYPKTFAYVRRFMDEVNRKKREGKKPVRLNGEAMKERVLGDVSGQPVSTTVIPNDPLQLQRGDEVEVFASDYGFTHKDRGALVGLTTTEVVIRNSQGLHIHFPRWNFRMEKVRQQIAKAPVTASKAAASHKMRLIYHPASPFSRKVFMVAMERGLTQSLTLESVVVCPVPFKGWSDNSDDVARYNPLAKIPCLVPEDLKSGLYDSRVICEYLENLAGVNQKKDPRYWQLHTLHACADGIMDAGVLLVYEKRIREPRGLRLDDWVTGQKTKINRALDQLDAAAKEGILTVPSATGAASMDEIAVAAAVGMMDSMGIKWRGSRDALKRWFMAWEGRKSYVESMPNKEWVAGGAHGAAKI